MPYVTFGNQGILVYDVTLSLKSFVTIDDAAALIFNGILGSYSDDKRHFLTSKQNKQ